MRIEFANLATATTATELPPGPYQLEIDGVDPNYVSPGEKASKALEVVCHIVEGMDFEDGSSTRGMKRTIRFWYPHSGQKDAGKFCLGRLNEFVKSCGLDTSSNGFDHEDLIGKRFIVRCKIKDENEEFDKFGKVS